MCAVYFFALSSLDFFSSFPTFQDVPNIFFLSVMAASNVFIIVDGHSHTEALIRLALVPPDLFVFPNTVAAFH